MNSEPVLRALLEEVGLDPEKALALLQNKKAVERFEDGIREALRKGEMQEERKNMKFVNLLQFCTLVRFILRRAFVHILKWSFVWSSATSHECGLKYEFWGNVPCLQSST